VTEPLARRTFSGTVKLFLLWWVLSTLGWGLGTLVAWVTEREMRHLLPGVPWYDLVPHVHVSSTVGLALFGMIVGLFQAWAIKRKVRMTTRSWVLTTTIGWLLESVSVAVTLNLGTTLAQWWLLRKHSDWAWIWPLFGFFAVLFASQTGVAVMSAVAGTAGSVVAILSFALPAGALYGAISGIGIAVISLTMHSEEQANKAIG